LEVAPLRSKASDRSRKRSWLQVWVLLVLGALLFVALTIALRETFTSPHPGANDFYIPWRAVRALVVEGRNPYSPEVTRDIQQVLFGGPRPPGTHQYAFAYPLTVLPLLAPLAPLPYDWAEAIWVTLSMWALLGGLFLSLRVPDWSPRPLFMAVLAIWALLFYPAARALILGQIAAIVFFLATASIYLLHRGHPAWAGVALAATTIKPQMVVLLIPILLLWATERRQMIVWRTFAVTLAGMVLLPLLWLPTWPLDFVRAVTDYAGYVPVGSPVGIALSALPASGVMTIALDGALMALLAYGYWRERAHGTASLLWLASLAIVVGLLIVPRGGTTNQVLLIIPCMLATCWFVHRHRGPLMTSLILALLLVLPWLLFLATVQGNTEQVIMFVPLPFAVLLLLWPIRPGGRPCAS